MRDTGGSGRLVATLRGVAIVILAAGVITAVLLPARVTPCTLGNEFHCGTDYTIKVLIGVLSAVCAGVVWVLALKAGARSAGP